MNFAKVLGTVTLSLAFSSAVFAKAPSLQVRIIYGNDDRVEADQYSNANFVKRSSAVAIRVKSKHLSVDPNNINRILFPLIPLEDTMPLCDNQPFIGQNTLGDCTGFLVGKKTLVTAGHCMKDLSQCTDNKWAFGYKEGVESFSTSQVYSCKKIIAQKLTSVDKAYDDYAVIELDREVTGVTPLEINKAGNLAKDTSLVIIGHPLGLPMKIADNAVVKTEGNDEFLTALKNRPNFFAANLDSYGGNSGSPVFNQATGKVEGILVQGRGDWTMIEDSCYVSKLESDTNVEGFEMVMRINKVPGI